MDISYSHLLVTIFWGVLSWWRRQLDTGALAATHRICDLSSDRGEQTRYHQLRTITSRYHPARPHKQPSQHRAEQRCKLLRGGWRRRRIDEQKITANDRKRSAIPWERLCLCLAIDLGTRPGEVIDNFGASLQRERCARSRHDRRLVPHASLKPHYKRTRGRCSACSALTRSTAYCNSPGVLVFCVL